MLPRAKEEARMQFLVRGSQPDYSDRRFPRIVHNLPALGACHVGVDAAQINSAARPQRQQLFLILKQHDRALLCVQRRPNKVGVSHYTGGSRGIDIGVLEKPECKFQGQDALRSGIDPGR